MSLGRNCILFGFVVLGGLAASSATEAQQPPAGSVPVATVSVERKAISRSMDFVARVEAVETVDIRARVKGYLESVQFTEGAVVKVGDPLYRIEQGEFESDVTQAEGALNRSEASLTLAIVQRQRAQELLDKKVGTVVARDQAVAAEQNAKGAVLAAQAALDSAKLNLSYTEIASPIAGRIGRTAVTKGNVVGPDSGPLVTIVSQDPTYVTFPVSQRQFQIAEQRGNTDPSKINVRVRFTDGGMYDQVGKIDFIDIKVNRSTDSVIVRALMPNPKGSLVDGQLVRAVLEMALPEERVLVPQASLLSDQTGPYVMVVEDGRAAMRRIKILAASGTDTILESGLSGGEQVIVEGVQRVRPGMPVVAAPAAPAPGTN
jgi:membrane fusion protein (multidrug efflux system)